MGPDMTKDADSRLPMATDSATSCSALKTVNSMYARHSAVPAKREERQLLKDMIKHEVYYVGHIMQCTDSVYSGTSL